MTPSFDSPEWRRASTAGQAACRPPLFEEATAALLAAMHEAAKHASGLLQTLALENEALRNSNTESLEGLLVIKQQQIASLEANARQQTSLLVALGYEFDSGGVEGVLSEARRRGMRQRESALFDAWERLRQLLSDCRADNLRNQGTLQNQQRRVRAALDILRGEPQTALYDAHGRTPRQTNAGTQRRFTKA